MIYADKIGSELIFWNDEGKKYSYDFKDKKFYSYNIGKLRRQVKNINSFFVHVPIHKIEWVNKSYKLLVEWIHNSEKRCRNIGTLIQRIGSYLYLEGYFLLNLKFEDTRCYTIRRPPEFYNKKVLKMFIKYKIPISHRLERAFENYYDFLANIFFVLDSMYDENRESRFFDDGLRGIIYQVDKLEELVNEYRYDTKHLLNYLCYLADYEAMDINGAIRLLLDYTRMMSGMQDKYIKYPRNLHTTHDIVIRNFNNAKKQYDDQLFRNAVKDYCKYEWWHDGYIILAPENTKSVQDEGVSLRHCVGGYINSIIDKRTKILFLRSMINWSDPLVTLEVRNNILVEARGFANRYTTTEEKKILKKWCKTKGIEYKVRGG